MKLYYTPGATSLAPRIIAFEAGLEIEYDKVDLKTKTPRVMFQPLHCKVAKSWPKFPLFWSTLQTKRHRLSFFRSWAPGSVIGLENGSISRVRSFIRASIRYGRPPCPRRHVNWP